MEKELLFRKAYGCLAGVAIGDAMGMPTTLYTPKQIKGRFGRVRDFFPAPEDHIIHKGMKAGQITDDTETTLIIARTIIEDKRVTSTGVARRLVEWAVERKVVGTDYLGPSTSRAIEKLISGTDPREAGKLGMTNGAASRISPIGIFNSGNFEGAVEDTEQACIPTHNTSVAISAACAVACAIAEASRKGATVDSIVKAAKVGAIKGEEKGLPIPSASVGKRIEMAVNFVKKTKNLQKVSRYLYEFIGCGVASNESVPTSIALFVAAKGEPMKAIIAGANIGGDTDTIASIVGGICGAYKGIEAFPKGLLDKIEEVNHLSIEKVAEDLVSQVEGR
jgi:ADP-ribosylglycohydrolase